MTTVRFDHPAADAHSADAAQLVHAHDLVRAAPAARRQSGISDS
ncbi:hypothetical protein [Nocardia sp. NPDC057440]